MQYSKKDLKLAFENVTSLENNFDKYIEIFNNLIYENDSMDPLEAFKFYNGKISSSYQSMLAPLCKYNSLDHIRKLYNNNIRIETYISTYELLYSCTSDIFLVIIEHGYDLTSIINKRNAKLDISEFCKNASQNIIFLSEYYAQDKLFNLFMLPLYIENCVNEGIDIIICNINMYGIISSAEFEQACIDGLKEFVEKIKNGEKYSFVDMINKLCSNGLDPNNNEVIRTVLKSGNVDAMKYFRAMNIDFNDLIDNY